jgi:hypothetical protein
MSDAWVRTGVRWTFRPSGRRDRGAARVGLAEREAALARAPLFADLPKRARRQLARVSGVSERGEAVTVVREPARSST